MVDHDEIAAQLEQLFDAIEAAPRLVYERNGLRNYAESEPLLEKDPDRSRLVLLAATRAYEATEFVEYREPGHERYIARFTGTVELALLLTRRALPLDDDDLLRLVRADGVLRSRWVPVAMQAAERRAKRAPISRQVLVELEEVSGIRGVEQKYRQRVLRLVSGDRDESGSAGVAPPPKHPPASVEPPTILHDLKRQLGLLGESTEVEVEILEPDHFPLRADSPLAAEHRELCAVVARLAEAGRDRWDLSLEAVLGPTILGASAVERGRYVLAALERRKTRPRGPEPQWLSYPGFARMAARELLDWLERTEFEPNEETALHLLLVWSFDSTVMTEHIVDQMELIRPALAGSAAARHLLDRIRRAAIESPPLGTPPQITRLACMYLDEPDGFVLVPGDVWADAFHERLRAMDDALRASTVSLVQHAATASSSKPSTKWNKSARKVVDDLGVESLRELASPSFALLNEPRRVQARHQSPHDLHEGNATVLRGFIWMLALDPEPEHAALFADLLVSCIKKIPGVGPRAVKVANACVWALGELAASDDEALRTSALAQLARLRARVTFKTTLNAITKALTNAAEAAGISLEELEELGVPDMGFTAGERRERLGESEAVLTIEGPKVVTRWTNAKGKVVKSPPAAVKRDHADEVKELKRAAKDAEGILAGARARLDGLYLQDASWSASDWRERYLDHGLVGALARRLIWTADGRAFLAHDGVPRDAEGAQLALEDAATVKLWHPIDASVDEVIAWRRRVEDLEVIQPFKQAHREIYRLTDAERATNVYSNRFAAHVIKQHQCHALMATRGWRAALRLMVDDMYAPPSRALEHHGLRAEFWVEPIGEETTDAGTYLFLATDQVRFHRLDAAEHQVHASGGGYSSQGREGVAHHAPLPLDSIPAVVLSEVLRDADLFVGVSSIGNDPNWVDGGADVPHRDYWQSFSFGELNATAQTRRELLERLVPRLAIAERCSFDDRFLVVRGDVRTYRIHLGSGNILMEPNDEYLCIVPDSRQAKAGDKVQLPFEGDRTLSIILSKAFLLAADASITDSTIVSQIRVR